MQGQLYEAERQALYNWVKEINPATALEVGTWKGGGSTYYIAQAITGTLHTCETNTEYYAEAKQLYKDNPRVKLYNIPSHILINELIQEGNIPQFTFFDGPNDPNVTLNDFKQLNPYLLAGSYFACHDWDPIEHRDGDKIIKSVKAELIRPYLEQSPEWELREYLTAPESVGLVLWVKKYCR